MVSPASAELYFEPVFGGAPGMGLRVGMVVEDWRDVLPFLYLYIKFYRFLFIINVCLMS